MKAPGWHWVRDQRSTAAADRPTAPELSIEDNPVVATILGPRGETLSEMHQRPIIDFGYHRPSDEPTA